MIAAFTDLFQFVFVSAVVLPISGFLNSESRFGIKEFIFFELTHFIVFRRCSSLILLPSIIFLFELISILNVRATL
jgi:hypothetical protein